MFGEIVPLVVLFTCCFVLMFGFGFWFGWRFGLQALLSQQNQARFQAERQAMDDLVKETQWREKYHREQESSAARQTNL